MDLGIRDRTALVAASSQGLGRAVAEALADEGAKVALCSRDAAAAEKAAADIAARHRVETYSQAADVTDAAAVKKFVAGAREKLGPISICVSNCGGPPRGKFEDFDASHWKRAFELSFLSTLYLIEESLPDMKAQSWGRVVSITSVSAKQPIDGLILSNGIRGGVVGLMKSLSNEYAANNILFNNVGPGMTKTERLMSLVRARVESEGRSEDEILTEMAQAIPIGRVARPEEFAAAVAFLCSERASYVTGVNLMIDGGLTKGV